MFAGRLNTDITTRDPLP